MTLTQQIITIGLCVLGTMTTRFLPFMIFNEHRKTPEFVQYLGKYLPSAVFGMLVIYCLKNVSVFHGSHGIPELISILVTGGLHIWKRQMLISIAGGTICYMLLMQFVFQRIQGGEEFLHRPVFVFLEKVFPSRRPYFQKATFTCPQWLFSLLFCLRLSLAFCFFGCTLCL